MEVTIRGGGAPLRCAAIPPVELRCGSGEMLKLRGGLWVYYSLVDSIYSVMYGANLGQYWAHKKCARAPACGPDHRAH
jgi:hypothetical protein